MKKTRLAILVAIACTFVGYAVVAVRGSDEDVSNTIVREPLQGFRGVWVLVESVRPEAKADGLSEDMIRTAVELKLRSLGIKVVSRSTHLSGDPYYARLYVNANMCKLGPVSSYAYSVSVECQDRVKLRRPPYRVCAATIWDQGYAGYASASSMPEKIKEAAVELTEYFANDYLAANPK